MSDTFARWPMRWTMSRSSTALGVVGVLCLMLVVALTDAVREHNGWTSVDGPTARWFAQNRTPTLDSAALHISTLTSPAVVAVLCAVAFVVLWRSGHRRSAVVLVAAAGVALVTSAGLKVLVGRPRPLAPLNLTPELEPSFPSGHVLVLGTVVLIVMFLLGPRLSRRARVAMIVLGSLALAVVSVDRLVLDAHWLTDVVASLALSVVLVCAVLAGDVAVRSVMRRRAARHG